VRPYICVEKESNELPPEQRESTTHLSPEPAPESPTPAGSKPSSMPVPAVPRRAAPPRRKPAKSASPLPAAESPPESEVHIKEEPKSTPSLGEVETVPVPAAKVKEEEIEHKAPFLESAPVIIKQEEDDEVDFSSLPARQDEPTEPHSPEPDSLVRDQPSTKELDAVVQDQIESPPRSDVEYKHDEPKSGTREELEAVAVGEKEIEKLSGIEQPEEALEDDAVNNRPAQPEEDEDEDEEGEATRRTRIAERLAKSGGINPFAAGAAFASPPGRKASVGSVKKDVDDDPSSQREGTSVVDPPSRKTSIDQPPSRKSSINVRPLPPPRSASLDLKPPPVTLEEPSPGEELELELEEVKDEGEAKGVEGES
jgi:hypothetical protein